MYVDNFYTSVTLAEKLLRKKTYLLGTVRGNRKLIPKIKITDLERGDVVAYENAQKVVYMAWKDKRLVQMLSTKLKLGMRPVQVKRKMIDKPTFVLKYNDTKQGIDLSDQLSSYQSAVHKSVRWYHKVAEEVLLGTAVVNASIFYNQFNARVPGFRSMMISEFRERLIYSLIGIQGPISPVKVARKKNLHTLSQFTERDSSNRLRRKPYKNCYALSRCMKQRSEARKKVKKVSTYCKKCPNGPAFCLPCFTQLHTEE